MTGLVAALICVGSGSLTSGSFEGLSPRDRELFSQRIEPLLKREVWDDSLAYLGGQYLVVPVHAAFKHDESRWIESYRSHMRELVKQPKEELVQNPLSRMQYLYVGSQYLALRSEKTWTNDERELRDYLTRMIVDRWRSEDAIAYDSRPFRGVAARVQHKLGMRNPRVSHFQAITDEEMFLFAIACDLLRADRNSGERNSRDRDLRDIRDTAVRVFKTFGENRSGGGWLFQPGAWRDHPDNAHAGKTSISRGLGKAKRDGVAWDASHFHRFAAFVLSYRDAFEPSSANYRFFEDIRKRHAQQFVSEVLVMPGGKFEGVRTKNYMDGWNGVYRYGRGGAIGRDNGYGPYELSGTFLLGWWSLLGREEIQDAYATMTSRFPLEEKLLEVYIGPVYKPKSERTAQSWYENGMGELFVSLASKMPY